MAAALFVTRSCCLYPAKDALLRSTFIVKTPVVNQTKGFASQARSGFRRANMARNPTLKERLLAPEQGTGKQ